MSAAPTARTALELLVPGLFGHDGRPVMAGAPAPRLSSLDLLLTRGEMLAAVPTDGHVHAMCARLGLTIAEQSDIPFAACSYLANTGTQPGSYCLHLTPVGLSVDRNRAFVLRPDELGLETPEVDALFDTVAAHLREDGLALSRAGGVDWVVTGEADSDLQTTSLYDAPDRDAEAGVPRGKDAKVWRVRINEIQMLLHLHPVNRQREAQGRAPVNSVWPWGGGRLPVISAPRKLDVAVEDARLDALARAAGAASTQVHDYAGWLGDAATMDRLLVVSRLLRAIAADNHEAWANNLHELDTALAGVVTDLRARRLAAVTISDGQGRGCRVTARALRRLFGARRGRYAALAAGR